MIIFRVGGVLLDIGYHLIDLMVWYFGKPIVKHAQCGNNNPDLYSPEDTVSLSFNFNTNAIGDLFVSCIYPHKNEGMMIIGKKGAMYCMNGKLEVINANYKIINSYDFSNERSKAISGLLDAFALLCSHNGKYNESDAFIHHENHMSIMNDAYQIINGVKKL